jgi:hypothetical protein
MRYGARLFESAIGKSGAPTASQLAAINRFTLKPLSADGVATYRFQAANNQIDRDGECFPVEVLHDFAATAPGKSVLSGHNWGPAGFGAIYDAFVEEDDDGTAWLMLDIYIPRGTVEGDEMIKKADSGVWRFVSVGFNCASKAPGMLAGRSCLVYHAPAELLEVSAVFLGAQYDAGIVKSITRRLERQHGPRKSYAFLVPKPNLLL